MRALKIWSQMVAANAKGWVAGVVGGRDGWGSLLIQSTSVGSLGEALKEGMKATRAVQFIPHPAAG